MEAVRLHFPSTDIEPLRLCEGTHEIGWRDGLPGPVTGAGEAPLTLNVSRRGIWMSVSATPARIHVNGRRVHRIALLRSGDVIHIDNAELRLTSPPPPHAQEPPSIPTPAPETDPRLVLRALGGPDHGRCFTLGRTRLVGRSAKADVQVDDPACGERHAWLEPCAGLLWLRLIAPSGQALVNGQPVREAALRAGDQVAFSPRHRFVVETPQVPPPVQRAPDAATTPPTLLPSSPSPPLRPLIWLLAAAMLLAAVLAGVLLLGSA